MKVLTVALVALAFVPAAAARPPSDQGLANTQLRLVYYRAHDGRIRPAWLMLPIVHPPGPMPLVISPHGRGIPARENALFWGDLPGLGDFAVISPGGQGRRVPLYSWGYRGQIEDLARMPAIAERNGVDVDRSRVYAVGGSMGGQETLLLVAEHPHLLAGAAAFDPGTDMRLRYRDFAHLKYGRTWQRLAREEIGGTPAQVPRAYALRSPDHYTRRIARSGVPLQIYWSTRDGIIVDQTREAGLLASDIMRDHPRAPVWDFHGEWEHTAEFSADRRLPRALARFGLLPWADVPQLPLPVRPLLAATDLRA